MPEDGGFTDHNAKWLKPKGKAAAAAAPAKPAPAKAAVKPAAVPVAAKPALGKRGRGAPPQPVEEESSDADFGDEEGDAFDDGSDGGSDDGEGRNTRCYPAPPPLYTSPIFLVSCWLIP